MSMMDYDESWWKEDCPDRGVMLSHMKSSHCTPKAHPDYPTGHAYNQCCHCLATQPDPRSTMVMPAIDVAARLRALGYRQIPEPPVDEDPTTAPETEHDPNTPVEPRMATLQGPTGPLYGLGRGEMTPRAERRAAAYVGWRAWLAEHGGGEVGFTLDEEHEAIAAGAES